MSSHLYFWIAPFLSNVVFFSFCGKGAIKPSEIPRRMLAQYGENYYVKEDVAMGGKILKCQNKCH
jgi:hypothetical protein